MPPERTTNVSMWFAGMPIAARELQVERSALVAVIRYGWNCPAVPAVDAEKMTWMLPSVSLNHSGAQVLPVEPLSPTVTLRRNVQFTWSALRAKPIVLPVQLVV
nr:hypothetical protein GCM10020092_041660 [Actinoplanes digitatis]